MEAKAEKQLKKNFRLYYASEFFANSTFILPIFILFGKEYLGVSYFKAGVLYALMYLVVVSFDFASGVVADRWGRQRTFVLGMILQIVGMVPFVLTKNYTVLLLSVVIGGVGIALYSNTLDAQIFEESKSLGAVDRYQHANANKQMSIFAGRIGASIIGGLSYKIHPTLPYALTVAALLASLISGLLMKFSKNIIEDHHNTTKREHIKQAASVVYQSKALLKFVVVGSIAYMASDLLFSYYQPYFMQLDVSSVTLGYLYAAISIASMAGSFMMRTLPDRFSAHTIQRIGLVSILLNATILFTLKIPLVFVAPLIMGLLSSGLTDPNMRLYVNKHAVTKLRASILSLVTTIFSFGMVTAFFLSSYLADKLAPRQVLSIAITIVAIGLAVSLLVKTNEKYIVGNISKSTTD